MLIVELGAEPTMLVIDEGLAVMLKSLTMNIAVVEWDSVPLVPVIISM